MTKTFADRRAARQLADEFTSLAVLIRSGAVPSWAVLNVAPTVRMIAHVLTCGPSPKDESWDR
jgi:hypothetical protein